MEASPRKSGWQAPSRRAAATLAVVPLAFLLFASAWPCRQYHWDTLERAYLLDHPSHYLRSWDGSPRSQFLSFAHVLELPLAWLVGAVLPGDGLRALIAFEALAAAFALWLLGSIVLRWRPAPAAPMQAPPGAGGGALTTACLAQVTLGLALGFWKLGSSGQEKILALSTQLLFLLVFWRALSMTSSPSHGPRVATNPSSRRVAWGVAATLAVAILAHLSGSVLVPFAVLALLLGMPGTARAPLARGVAVGALVAGLSYYAVAAWTTGVRGPVDFLEYVTFFHRAEGINFWEPGGAAPSPGTRLTRMWRGLTSFFAGEAWAAAVVLLLLAAAIAMPFFERRRQDRRGTAADPTSGLRTLRRHTFLLGGLWTVHFAFFEPQNYESWTLLAALLVLVAAASLRKEVLLAAMLLPMLLLAGNLRPYAANHRELPLEGYGRAMARASRPGDLVVIAGGRSERKVLPGSLAMRYFLARLPGRTVVSLYDLLGLAGREYWGRPVESPAALQAALDGGRRAWAPSFALTELERAGLRCAPPAPGDSVVEITGVAARSVPPP